MTGGITHVVGYKLSAASSCPGSPVPNPDPPSPQWPPSEELGASEVPDSATGLAGGGLSHRLGTLKPKRRRREETMAVSVLFRIDRNGSIEVVDDGPTPAVVVGADGQLHAETGTITHAGEDLDGELWRWLS